MDGLLGTDEFGRHSTSSSSTMYSNQFFATHPTTGIRPQATSLTQWDLQSFAMPSLSPSHPQNAGLHSEAFMSAGDSQSTGMVTRRRRAAVARASEPSPSQLYSVGDQLAFNPSIYGMHPHIDPLLHNGSRAISPTHNLSANPADISPPVRRTAHSRHTSVASSFDNDPFSLSPSPPFSRKSNPYERASSPASSVASSSLASLSGSVGLQSQSTWSSTTNESSPARIADVDEISSSLSLEDRSPTKEKHTKNKLRNIDRKEMCLFAEQNPAVRQEDIALKFGVERSTVSKVLKNKDHWLNLGDDEDLLKVAKHRPIKFPTIEHDVLHWVQERSTAGEAITDAGLREQAKMSARKHGIRDEDFKASGGWIENFKQRNKIKRGKIQPSRSERRLDDDRASVSSSVDDSLSASGAALSSLTPDVNAIPTPTASEHRYPTRRKTMNPIQLQTSVEMVREFIKDVNPEGFTEAQKELWDLIEKRTMNWAREQMHAGSASGSM